MEPAPHYFVDIFWSEEDQVYLARVPELAGVVTHGETIAEAAKMAEDAIALHLESLKKHNEPIPEPVADRNLKGKFALRMGPERHQRLTVLADQRGISINDLLNEFIDERTAPNADRRIAAKIFVQRGHPKGSGKAILYDHKMRVVPENQLIHRSKLKGRVFKVGGSTSKVKMSPAPSAKRTTKKAAAKR